MLEETFECVAKYRTSRRFLSKSFFLTGGTKFYGSRMTSQEAILESLNFRLKTAFLGVPHPAVVKACLK
jgi:hypothetical protein